MNSKVFWEWCLKEWRSDHENLSLADFWVAYEIMRGRVISSSHFVGKLFGD